jgi:hypothetical protein
MIIRRVTRMTIVGGEVVDNLVEVANLPYAAGIEYNYNTKLSSLVLRQSDGLPVYETIVNDMYTTMARRVEFE